MSTTTIPLSGNNSPEYEAIRGNSVRLNTLFKVDPDNSSLQLFQAHLIPQPFGSKDDATAMLRSVLACVEHNAIMFYKFLGVLNTFVTRGKAELESINKKFVGKYSHCNYYLT